MADLITLEEYKNFKEITSTKNDSKLSFLISAVSSLIKTYCGHNIIDNWDEPFVEDITTPFEQDRIYLTGYPVREIISVEEFGPSANYYVQGLDSTIHYVVPATAYNISTGTGGLVRLGRNWTRSVRVTYTTGYEETPTDLKLAAIELVSHFYNEEWKPSRTTMGSTMAGPAPETTGIPKYIRAILDLYKVN